ncbi:putative serine protease K12H4.7 [Ceratitis capitata]|uniref:putative serine protease K12H4.7 n=1 Tax=Ceratitis capitata TaxID=7213 RepID=UPI000A1100A0|nr:putative serine protease K12H4.7 [Ceratitis capitata]
MRSLQIVLLLLFALTVSTATGKLNWEKLRGEFFNVTGTEGTLFVQSLKYLHREPPQEETLDRAISRKVSTKTIEQKLDHFDSTNEKTWQMRYMENDNYFKEGGPIFIYVGGEWSISSLSIRMGHFVDMAKEHDGLLFYTEHRYYGKSLPTSDLTVDNLKYLHVKQSLADLAHFIKYQRENYPGLENSKVIMAGGSYAASMVVWFKHTYPELLTGGWASSAPLLAKVDFREYKEVVGRALRELGSEQCYSRVQNGIATLEEMIGGGRAAEVKAMMKICDNFDEYNDLDVWTLFSSISNLFSGIVQYQSGNDVPNLCDFLMEQESDVVAIAKFLLRYIGTGCFDLTYKDTLTYYIDSTFAAGANRPWYYQTCNEYGWYQSSRSRNQPFGTKFPAKLYLTLCEDIFGENFTETNIYANVGQTNEDFGGYSPNAPNVYQTHGGLDPWSAAGHTAEQGATIIPLTSHCADFNSIRASDSAEMRASKETIAKLVREWLAEDSNDSHAN